MVYNDSNQRIAFSMRSIPAKTSRRRHPSTIYILTPDELRAYFAGFLNYTHSVIAKTLFGTGMRGHEVASINAGQIASLKPIYPGGPAHLKVVGKGNKERSVECESVLVKALKNYLVSPERLARAKLLVGPKNDPFDDSVPLFINVKGEPMSRRAITEAAGRNAKRCNIKRTPHELRHEFAANFLINRYREATKNLGNSQFDQWLIRLTIEKVSTTIFELAQRLGHSDPETTKRIYLRAIMNSNPAVRDAWNNHLESVL